MPHPKWLQWANQIRAIAQAGLTYTEGPYDRERYDRQLTKLKDDVAADRCSRTRPTATTPPSAN
jgi:hypothetical protein